MKRALTAGIQTEVVPGTADGAGIGVLIPLLVEDTLLLAVLLGPQNDGCVLSLAPGCNKTSCHFFMYGCRSAYRRWKHKAFE